MVSRAQNNTDLDRQYFDGLRDHTMHQHMDRPQGCRRLYFRGADREHGEIKEKGNKLSMHASSWLCRTLTGTLNQSTPTSQYLYRTK